MKACIFDLDGTLIDTIKSIAYFGNAALEKINLAPISIAEYKQLVGGGAKNLVKDMLKLRGVEFDQCGQSVLEQYSKAYDDDCFYLTEPYEGILELVAMLKENGIKMAVISNKPDSTTKQVIDNFFTADTFQVVNGAKDSIPLKPDPLQVLDAMQQMGVKAKDCIYIGDTAVDMKTGKNAGLFTVGVLWGFRDEKELKNANADVIISAPEQILEIINNL